MVFNRVLHENAMENDVRRRSCAFSLFPYISNVLPTVKIGTAAAFGYAFGLVVCSRFSVLLLI